MHPQSYSVNVIIFRNVLSLLRRTFVTQKGSLDDAMKESSLLRLTRCICKSFHGVFRVRTVLHPRQVRVGDVPGQLALVVEERRRPPEKETS